jgi:hypothetical protein
MLSFQMATKAAKILENSSGRHADNVAFNDTVQIEEDMLESS